MLSSVKKLHSNVFLFLYGGINLLAIALVNRMGDLPVLLGNWEAKASAMAHLHFPGDNFYPPGSSILLIPFLWTKPHYEIAVFFYFTFASLIYFMICQRVIKDGLLRVVALAALTCNPYLLWTCNSGQDTVFELFLLLSFGALLLKKRVGLSLFPLYLLCLTRPAYWALLLTFPLLVVINAKKNRGNKPQIRFALIPFVALFITMGLNVVAFGAPNLAAESGLTAHFSHNKYYYLSMPKFDMDVFLSKGGNMDPAVVLDGSQKFKSVKDVELRAALVSIVDNPKSFFLNTVQKIDSYFFAVQKTPQLPGSYYLSKDQKSIVIESERLSWVLLFGNAAYFIYRSLLLISGIVAITLFFVELRRRRLPLERYLGFFLLPFLAGAVPGIVYYTESRFKIVSELLLVPLIVAIFDTYRRSKNELKEAI